MKELLIISGLFGKKNSDTDEELLPPPPPFPGVEALDKMDFSNPTSKRKKRAKSKKEAEDDSINLEEAVSSREVSDSKPKNKRKKAIEFFHKTGVLKDDERKQMDDEHKKHYQEHKELVNQEVQEERKAETKKKKSSFLWKFRKKDSKNEESSELQSLDDGLDQLDDMDKASTAPDLDHIDDVGKSEEELFAEQEIAEAVQGVQQAEQKEKKKSIGIFGFLKKKKQEEPSEVVDEDGAISESQIEQPDVMPVTNDTIDQVEHIEEQIHRARLALMDFKFDEAKHIYISVMQEYNTLDEEKQYEVYEDIKDLYYERKNAEKFGSV